MAIPTKEDGEFLTYGKVVKIFGQYHIHVLCLDGERRGCNAMKPAAATTYPAVDDYLLIRLRSDDDLKADILYHYSLEDFLIPAAAMAAAKELLDFDEEEDEVETEAVLSFGPSKPRKSTNHHHYLYLITGIGDEEVYCDNCDRMVPEHGQSWTCLAPHCHFDECERCAGSLDNTNQQEDCYCCNHSTGGSIDVEEDEGFNDYPPPKFLLQAKVKVNSGTEGYVVRAINRSVNTNTDTDTHADVDANVFTSIGRSPECWMYTLSLLTGKLQQQGENKEQGKGEIFVREQHLSGMIN